MHGIDKRTGCVFVVDDDMAVRQSLKFALELEGFQAHACAGGQELLRHPELENAGCVIIDHRMPEMDGFAVIDRLASRSFAPPVILIASQVTDQVRRRARNSKIGHVLEKPLSGNVLIDAVREVVREMPA